MVLWMGCPKVTMANLLGLIEMLLTLLVLTLLIIFTVFIGPYFWKVSCKNAASTSPTLVGLCWHASYKYGFDLFVADYRHRVPVRLFQVLLLELCRGLVGLFYKIFRGF